MTQLRPSWTKEQIEAGRRRDASARTDYFEDREVFSAPYGVVRARPVALVREVVDRLSVRGPAPPQEPDYGGEHRDVYERPRQRR